MCSAKAEEKQRNIPDFKARGTHFVISSAGSCLDAIVYQCNLEIPLVGVTCQKTVQLRQKWQRRNRSILSLFSEVLLFSRKGNILVSQWQNSIGISMEANILAVFIWSYVIHKGSYSLPFPFVPDLFILSQIFEILSFLSPTWGRNCWDFSLFTSTFTHPKSSETFQWYLFILKSLLWEHFSEILTEKLLLDNKLYNAPSIFSFVLKQREIQRLVLRSNTWVCSSKLALNLVSS